MRNAYPSDITRAQYEIVRYYLETARKTTRPRQYDLYDILCGILYVLKQGCTWRALPHDFPKWNITYYYFQMWTKALVDGQSIMDHVLRELVVSERVTRGRDSNTTMGIVDSRSVKNADTAKEKGYDGGKKRLV